MWFHSSVLLIVIVLPILRYALFTVPRFPSVGNGITITLSCELKVLIYMNHLVLGLPRAKRL